MLIDRNTQIVDLTGTAKKLASIFPAKWYDFRYGTMTDLNMLPGYFTIVRFLPGKSAIAAYKELVYAQNVNYVVAATSLIADYLDTHDGKYPPQQPRRGIRTK